MLLVITSLLLLIGLNSNLTLMIYTDENRSNDEAELPCKFNVYNELKIIFDDHKNVMK